MSDKFIIEEGILKKQVYKWQLYFLLGLVAVFAGIILLPLYQRAQARQRARVEPDIAIYGNGLLCRGRDCLRYESLQIKVDLDARGFGGILCEEGK